VIFVGVAVIDTPADIVCAASKVLNNPGARRLEEVL
jgi:hypothetical protein